MLLERLLDNLSLRVRPFASCHISPHWRLRLAGDEAVTLHFVLEGQGTIVTPRTALTLSPGSLAIVPARIPHSLASGENITRTASASAAVVGPGGVPRYVAGEGAGSEVDRLLVACGHIEVVYAGAVGLFDFLRDPLVLDFPDVSEMHVTFERLLREQHTEGPTSRAMIGALMTQSLVLIFRRLCAEPECPLPWLQALEDPDLGPALSAILEDPGRRHSLESLAAATHLSRSAFVARFAQCFAMTPMAFLRLVRLRTAAALLTRTSLPVEAVGTRVGFASRSHFSSAFHRWSGRSPAQFRREQQTGAGGSTA